MSGPRAGMTVVRGVRWCSVKDAIVDWEEDEEAGCHWCGPDTFFAQNHKTVAVLDAE